MVNKCIGERQWKGSVQLIINLMQDVKAEGPLWQPIQRFSSIAV